MPDREKVVKAFVLCRVNERCSTNCPYWNDNASIKGCTKKLATDVYSLLKEQEAKPMTEYDDGWDCPRCGLKLIGKTASGYPYDVLDLPNDEIVKYCPVCGQAVKWE